MIFLLFILLLITPFSYLQYSSQVVHTIMSMFQSNKKFNNIKNIGASQDNIKLGNLKSEMKEPAAFQEHHNNPYVPYEDCDYTKILEGGTIKCPFGLNPNHVFPRGDFAEEREEKVEAGMPYFQDWQYLNQRPNIQEPKPIQNFESNLFDEDFSIIQFESEQENDRLRNNIENGNN